MPMPSTSGWNDLAAQQLVRYEALFGLIDDIQALEDVAAISRRVATQWKYFANVACWRLVVADGDGFLVIDGHRGEAVIEKVATLSAWDAAHWRARRPSLVRPADGPLDPGPPEHLAGQAIREIDVLPFFRDGECISVLSAGSRREPFGELDSRFVRLFGGYFTERVTSLLQRQQITEVLVAKATRDELTDLLNRGAIIDVLGRHLALAGRTGAPLAVVLLDVDLFKRINDTFGHLVGDDVLREVAQRLQSQLRDSDALGRYGGEEFLAVLYPCTADEAAAVAERFRRAVGDVPMAVGPGQSHRVTISLGTCSTEPRPDLGLTDLLKRADDALYRSKAGGRDRVTADPA